MTHIIEIEGVEEKITVTIKDVVVVADNEEVNDQLRLFLADMIDNHSHALPSIESSLADKVIEMFGGKMVLAEEEEEEPLPEGAVN
jgi:division protein CdvB (Snf7/Vps24/ESCRT-III family)